MKRRDGQVDGASSIQQSHPVPQKGTVNVAGFEHTVVCQMLPK